MELEKTNIKELDRTYRLNLINSITGIKPANLIGTRSKNQIDNVAIFSSVVHLGSNPAQIGFVVRPKKKTPRDTFVNINETGYYTINHITQSMIHRAHATSANVDSQISEFDLMKMDRMFIKGFLAPFVKESPVKIGMKHIQNVPLPNGTTFIIGSVENIIIPDESINDLGELDLSTYDCAGISGLNTYYNMQMVNRFPYIKANEIPSFE